MGRNSLTTENDCKTKSKRRLKGNPGSINRHKSAKFKRKEKNTWPWKESKKAADDKELHGKIISDRLTVPQKKRMQSGLYVKGKISGICHKNGGNLNALNEARANEKVCDLITLANKTEYRVMQDSLGCNEICNDLEIYTPDEHNYCYKNQQFVLPQNHQLKSFRERDVKDNKMLSYSDEDDVVMKSKIDSFNETSLPNNSNKNMREFDDSSYIEYRAFIKHFDYMYLKYQSEEDFITKEKNNLKKKLRMNQQSREKHSTFVNSGETRKSLNSSLNETQGCSDTKEARGICLQNSNAYKMKMTKKNPNYLPFKKQTKIIVHTTVGQKKHLPDRIDDDNVLKCSQTSLPNSTASKSPAFSPEAIAFSSQLSHIPPTKGTSLDPVNFLKNTLDSDNSLATDLPCEPEFCEEVELSETHYFQERYSPPKIFSDLMDENTDHNYQLSDHNYQYFDDDDDDDDHNDDEDHHQYLSGLGNNRSKGRITLGEVNTVPCCQKNYSPNSSLLFPNPALKLTHELNRNFSFGCSREASTENYYHFSSLNSSEECSLQSQELYQPSLSSYPIPCGFQENQLEGISAGQHTFWQRRRMF